MVTFENVSRPASETTSSVKNALEYNVYHGGLCYLLNKAFSCITGVDWCVPSGSHHIHLASDKPLSSGNIYI